MRSIFQSEKKRDAGTTGGSRRLSSSLGVRSTRLPYIRVGKGGWFFFCRQRRRWEYDFRVFGRDATWSSSRERVRKTVERSPQICLFFPFLYVFLTPAFFNERRRHTKKRKKKYHKNIEEHSFPLFRFFEFRVSHEMKRHFFQKSNRQYCFQQHKRRHQKRDASHLIKPTLCFKKPKVRSSLFHHVRRRRSRRRAKRNDNNNNNNNREEGKEDADETGVVVVESSGIHRHL